MVGLSSYDMVQGILLLLLVCFSVIVASWTVNVPCKHVNENRMENPKGD